MSFSLSESYGGSSVVLPPPVMCPALPTLNQSSISDVHLHTRSTNSWNEISPPPSSSYLKINKKLYRSLFTSWRTHRFHAASEGSQIDPWPSWTLPYPNPVAGSVSVTVLLTPDPSTSKNLKIRAIAFSSISFPFATSFALTMNKRSSLSRNYAGIIQMKATHTSLNCFSSSSQMPHVFSIMYTNQSSDGIPPLRSE